jgi:hypothetical protein
VFAGAAGLPAGTAQVTVTVRTLVPPRRCSAHRRTITTGDQASGISALISKEDELIAAAVGINRLVRESRVTGQGEAIRRSRI